MTPPPLLRRRPLLQAAALAPCVGLSKAFAQAVAQPIPATTDRPATGIPQPMTSSTRQPEQKPQTGRVERWTDYRSRHVATRHIDVWLPPDYDQRARDGERFGVLYMHDGQGLFDATTTWNHQAWAADVAATAAMQAAPGRSFIIVGPWNGGALRHSEYFPAAYLPHLPAPLRDRFVREMLQGEARSDAYLRFLVEELKPAVDARYATRDDRESTWLMGSSMGGVISSYALWEYPQVFSAAGCLSTHWIGIRQKNEDFPAAAVAYLQKNPPRPATVRLWTDRGTQELDAEYIGAHERVTDALNGMGFAPPGFHAEVVADTGHNERDWSRRAERVMRFVTTPVVL